MKNSFKEPSFEVVRFNRDILVTSGGCGCFYEDVGYDLITDETCTGANVSCSCNPNQSDPNANCE